MTQSRGGLGKTAVKPTAEIEAEKAAKEAEKKVKFGSAVKRAEQEAAGTTKSQGRQSLLQAGTLNGSLNKKRKGLGG
jgi:hypothetical protein